MKMPKMFSKPLRAIACLALVAILGLVLVTGAGAQTQVSGSLPIEPDKGQNPPGDVLNENEIVNVAVYLVNTSTFNGVNADIRVTGTTVINLSCDDSNCSNHFAALVFDDCFEETGVLTCLPNIADPSIVEINYSAPGKLLPAALKTKLVTIVAHVVPGEQILSPASGLFYANGWTGKADLNMFLVASPGTRNNTTGAAPLYYPAFCGDGVVGNTPGETCDPPGQPGPGSANLCRANCTYCGDGIVNNGEQCDDGNNVNGDGCENNCTPTPICGDSIIGNTPGETCDPPGQPGPGSANLCRANCTYCGDGIVNDAEQCDDGNSANGDGCSATCQNEVALGGCRVTGGGVIDRIDTEPPVNGETHGGQVGAPVGVAIAFADQASECIQGEWEHVRHVKGSADNCTSPSVCGNFHARTFDTLQCGCLPCCEDQDTGVVVENLCNPDDKICGPEPREAPANKICFSGVGDYTFTKGKKSPQIAVFRVDIEDRSEPGTKPKADCDPTDRYRMRMWFVQDANSDEARDLRLDISCGYLGEGDIVASKLPNIDDGGDLETGNHQIHPSLKATCP